MLWNPFLDKFLSSTPILSTNFFIELWCVISCWLAFLNVTHLATPCSLKNSIILYKSIHSKTYVSTIWHMIKVTIFRFSYEIWTFPYITVHQYIVATLEVKFLMIFKVTANWILIHFLMDNVVGMFLHCVSIGPFKKLYI